ncbi:hypothetical protein CBR_g11990 [Chara braunii]|uniref:pectinesterase n=1 Tax=Chara braunii TaxID=69332 RepID=A0A388KQR2_CHABU|nr:hypothetical protein CBR_g11990 [Chara braunii]|eukprot:GBG72411.1 hypothetical protein CBR_g11990 [Chara braunii]
MSPSLRSPRVKLRHARTRGLTMMMWVVVIVAVAVAACMPLTLLAAPAGPGGPSTSLFVGPGGYSSVQAALDAAPAGSRIVVMAGTYREKVVVAKPAITLIADPAGFAAIIFNDAAKSAGGTVQSATFTVSAAANGFTAIGLTFANDFGPNEKGTSDQQGVAVAVSADSSFYNCTITGWQDTLYADQGRQYYKTCLIQGSVDFAFGEATAFFEDCTLFARMRPDSKYNSYTAQKRESPTEAGGFVFYRGMLDCDPVVKAYLGRGWGPYARTIFILTYMKDCVNPEGWGVFKKYKYTDTTFFAEYHCSGPGSNRAGRVPWSRNLTDAEVFYFSNRTSFLQT